MKVRPQVGPDGRKGASAECGRRIVATGTRPPEGHRKRICRRNHSRVGTKRTVGIARIGLTVGAEIGGVGGGAGGRFHFGQGVNGIDDATV